MPVKIIHVFNQVQLEKILISSAGGVAKDLLKRGVRVQSRARRNLSGVTGSGPRRVNTGHLRASIGVNLVMHTTDLAVRVGTNVFYAIYVHNGTGLYGPKHAVIRPKRARALVFKSKIYGAKRGKFAGRVVVSYVRGMKPNPFLENALKSASLKNPA